DEIALLVKHFNISRREAIRRYLDEAGLPARRPQSREYPELPQPRKSPEFPGSPESPVCHVSPVSNGQALDQQLRELAARNCCTERSTARKRRFKLLRDLKALEKQIGWELTIDELMAVFDEWHRLSQPFLDPTKTRDDYLVLRYMEVLLWRFGKVEKTRASSQQLKRPPST